jgi:hypothetical protein
MGHLNITSQFSIEFAEAAAVSVNQFDQHLAMIFATPTPISILSSNYPVVQPCPVSASMLSSTASNVTCKYNNNVFGLK